MPKFSACIWLILLVFVIGPVYAQDSDNTSAWGEIITLGQADQRNAPTIWLHDDAIIAIWSATSGRDTLQFMRAATYSGQLSEITSLPLPPVFPHQQTLKPTRNPDEAHLFWLDAAQNNQGGGIRLWGEIVNTDLERTRAEIVLSDGIVYQYDAIGLADGTAQVVWSTGNRAEPTIYRRDIDAQGRPREQIQIATDADWPTILIEEDGRIAVYWLSLQQATVGRVIIAENGPSEQEILTRSVNLRPTDHLLSFEVGQDQTHTYLFWNVRRANGVVETWMSSTPQDSNTWQGPERLAITVIDGTSIETGFNGGPATAAASGATTVQWLMPATGRFALMPVAAQIGDQLGVLYLQAGEVVAFQPVADLSPIGLIGIPGLIIDRESHIYLTWAQPSAAGLADLNITTTR